ncbi:MAG: TetR/AcrR family transcriptional regulator [Planctomycetota bacterium]
MKSPKRDDLIETALGLFCTHGIHAVGIDRIIEEAGVAKATLYKHFASKDDLVIAVLEQMDQLAVEKTRDAAQAASGGPVESFASLARMTARGSRHGCIFVLAAQEFPSADHPVHRSSREHKRKMRQLYAELAEVAGATDPAGAAVKAQLILDGLYSAGAVCTADGRAAAEHAETLLRELVTQ